jgi:uncharacterized membrane protein
MKATAASNLRTLFHISLLGILGVLVSIYLVYDHIKDDESSFCDVGQHISCSKVRRSVFSEIFKVPIAVFGLFFNIVTVLGALLGIQSDSNTAIFYITSLFFWNVMGTAFVFYLIFAEIYLQALCPFCTVLHISQMLVIWLIWKVYSSLKNAPSLFETLWAMKHWVIIIGIVNFVPLVYFNSSFAADYGTIGQEPPVTNEEFASCITHFGWRFYGLAGCGYCEKQKLLFGKTIGRIIFTDCSAQRDGCQELDIDGYPTWIRFDETGLELDRWKGYASLETWMKVLTDCKKPYLE